MDDVRRELDRLTARLDRERRARREAELIAERGLREHWRLTRELDERVAERTADLEREIAGHAVLNEFIVELVSSVIRDRDVGGSSADQLDWIEILSELPSAPPRSSSAAPVEVADRATRRWQRVLARSGHLLSIDVDPTAPPAIARWDVILIALDLVLASTHRWARPGGVTIGIDLDPLDVDGASVRVTVQRPPGRVGQGRSPVLEAAAAVVTRAGGELSADRAPDHLVLRLRAPIGAERQLRW